MKMGKLFRFQMPALQYRLKSDVAYCLMSDCRGGSGANDQSNLDYLFQVRLFSGTMCAFRLHPLAILKREVLTGRRQSSTPNAGKSQREEHRRVDQMQKQVSGSSPL